MDTLLTIEEVREYLNGIAAAFDLKPVGTYTPAKGKAIPLYSGAEVARRVKRGE